MLFILYFQLDQNRKFLEILGQLVSVVESRSKTLSTHTAVHLLKFLVKKKKPGLKCSEAMKTEVMNSDVMFPGGKPSDFAKVFAYLLPFLFALKMGGFFRKKIFTLMKCFLKLMLTAGLNAILLY